MMIEKIKAFAMGAVGAGIFSMGSTYFSEKSIYRIPRLLLPIYEFFGNIGLAIGMLILGGVLMYFAFNKFKVNKGSAKLFLLFQLIALGVFYVIIFTTESDDKASVESIKASIERDAKERKSSENERTVFENKNANQYLDRLEALLAKYQKSHAEKNKVLFDECEKEYLSLTSTEFKKVVIETQLTKEYGDFLDENANILAKINTLRQRKIK